MPRRSITDEEISLIKALLSRGMANKNIQFLFNRPDRAVNSGRITDIANGSYSNSAEIPIATDEQTTEFLANHEHNNFGVIEVPARGEINKDFGPTDDVVVRKLFERVSEANWCLRSGESERIECKSNVNLKGIDEWGRALAAMANNKGGYLIVGVLDPKHETNTTGKFLVNGKIGTRFSDTDIKEFTSRLRNHFDPTPIVQKQVLELDASNSVGILYVEEASSKPVIVNRQAGKLKEGDILFRYPGETNRIKYSDLRQMLDQRDLESREKMIPIFSKLAALGPESALVADMNSGEVLTGNRKMKFDPSLVEAIKEAKTTHSISGASQVTVVGELTQPGAGDRITVVNRDILEEYPLTATEVNRIVRSKIPNAKQNEIWDALAPLKGNPSYSAYRFSSREKEQRYLRTGKLTGQVPVIYNDAAVQRVCETLG